jgi:hypothetical protein
MPAFSWTEFAILFGAAVFGSVCILPYSLELNAEAIRKARERLRQPLWVLVLLQSTQGVVLMGIATGLGLLLAHQIGLGAPLIEGVLAGTSVAAQAQALLAPALILGIGSSTVLMLLEIVVFWPRLPQSMRETVPIPALWKRFLACFYGGIDEEILLRLFVLSLLAWLITFVWHVPGGAPTVGAFWLANILAAVLFGLGHLPATAALTKVTPLLVVRAIVLNGIVGVAAGYLFVVYGLEAAMLCHFAGDIVIHMGGDSLAKRLRAVGGWTRA